MYCSSTKVVKIVENNEIPQKWKEKEERKVEKMWKAMKVVLSRNAEYNS